MSIGIINMNIASIDEKEILSIHFSGTPDHWLHSIPMESAIRAKGTGYNKSVAKSASIIIVNRSNFSLLS